MKIQKLFSFREKDQEGSFQQNKERVRQVRLPPEQRGRISFMSLLSEPDRKRLKRLHLLGFPKRSLRVDLTAPQPSTQGGRFSLSDKNTARSRGYKMKPAEFRHTGYNGNHIQQHPKMCDRFSHNVRPLNQGNIF